MNRVNILLFAAVAIVCAAQVSALGGRLDLAFVLDDSGSAGDDKKNWTLVKSFASDIVNSLSISSTAVRVGMVKYSDRAFTEFYFSNHTTSSAVRAAIMNASYLGFTTNHTGALNMAKDNLFREDNGCRTNATNIIVLVTDGQQNVFDGHTLASVSSKLQERCINVITVQIWGGYVSGPGPSVHDARNLTSAQYQVNATNYANLASKVSTVVSKINTLEQRSISCPVFKRCTANPCFNKPCQNGGTCSSSSTTAFQCACVLGYTGNRCQTNLNECASNPCLNGGTCTDGTNRYTCRCLNGFTGNRCQININDCAPNPCQNRGVCTDGVNSYTCSCPGGSYGQNCQFTSVTACSTSPCQNNGVCTANAAGYTCQCQSAWTGNNCQIPASTGTCANNPCQNGGTCSVNGATFTCQCTTGWRGLTCDTASGGAVQTDKVQMTILAILLVLTGVFLILSLILICCVFCGACTRRRRYYEEQRDAKESCYSSDIYAYNNSQHMGGSTLVTLHQ